jgi:ABC-type transport system substrate-binding protein
MQFGRRIALRLKELGLTQGQLAEKTGVTQSVISKYVRGKTTPSYDAIVSLSKVLDVHPGWFFPESDSNKSSPQVITLKPIPNPKSADIVVLPPSGKIPRGTTFVIGHWFPMQDYPHPTEVRSSGITTNFYDLIFNKLAEDIPHGQLRGTLAIHWTSLETGWVFQLREGVKFHNGKLLTAKDVKWSYERYLQRSSQDTQIEGVEPLSENLIAIHTKSPCRLQEIAMPFILPEGAKDIEWIGTGPFRPVELNPNFWRLKQNPDYFLSHPYFDEIQIRQYPDAQTLEQALVDGEVHFAIGVYHAEPGFITKAEASAVRYHLHFMLNDPFVQNPALRGAIALALDVRALAKAAGLKEPLYASGPFDYLLGDRWKTPPPPHPEAARQLLKQITNLKDSVFRVEYFQNLPESRFLAEEIVKQLNQIGIPAAIGAPAHARVLIRPAHPFERECSMWETKGLHNLNGYSNPQVDQLIETYEGIAPIPDQLLELRRLIQSDLPDIPLFYFEIPLTYVKRLRALADRVVLLSCLNEIHTWYLDEEVKVAEEAQIASSA